MGKKSIPKSITFLMLLGINLWMDFGGFWMPKWIQVGMKMGSNIVVYLEGRFFKIRALATARVVPRGYPIERSDRVPPLALTVKMESKLGCILASIFH